MEKNFDDRFSRFDTVPASDGRTDRQTDGRKGLQQYCALACSHMLTCNKNLQPKSDKNTNLKLKPNKLAPTSHATFPNNCTNYRTHWYRALLHITATEICKTNKSLTFIKSQLEYSPKYQHQTFADSLICSLEQSVDLGLT